MIKHLTGYVLSAAIKDKIFLLFVGLVAIILSLSIFFGSSAVIEQDQFSTVFTSGALRIASSFTLILFIVFYFRRSFDNRDVDELVGSALLWGFTLFLELVVLSVMAMFFGVALSTAVSATLMTVSFYILARLMGDIIGILESGITNSFKMRFRIEKDRRLPFAVFVFFLISMIFSWFWTKDIKAQWLNVPPVPSEHTASFIALGDDQMAYRFYAVMLQNLGNTSGEFQSLKNYNYEQLNRWFFTLDQLDERSDAVPLLAAHYFGSVLDKEKLSHIYDYLATVGQRPIGEKWRWLGHAVFLARHISKDTDKALELANLLAANESPDLAEWAKQMPAFILAIKR